MVEHMVTFFVSWFANPSIMGIVLALIFGSIWLVSYWPPLFQRYWLWAVFFSSAILSLVAVTFIQIPLQYWSSLLLARFLDNEVLMRWLPLTAVPAVLLSGLVQEGAKMVPMVVWWWRNDRNIDPRLGLVIGVVAGAGFGVFEAVWAHNNIFASGWTWEAVQTGGLMALAGFWERFFAVAFHIAVSALVGYGLARGWGWRFYLIGAFLHSVLNYSAVLLPAGIFTVVYVEIYLMVVAVLVSGVALWLRWKKPAELA